jgi:alpha-L-fucosidase 2
MTVRNREVWFAGPAERWINGLPVGNGRTGAMWYGEAANGVIALNDETFWSPGPSHRDLTGAQGALAEVRALLHAGDPPASQRAARTLLGAPAEMAAFQPLGDLRIRHDRVDRPQRYRRSLDLITGTATLDCAWGDGARLEQRLTALRDPSVLVLRTSAPFPLALTLASPFGGDLVDIDDRTVVLTGQWREGVPEQHPVGAGSYRLRDYHQGRALRFAVAIRLFGPDAGPTASGTMPIPVGDSVLAITTATDYAGGDPVSQCLSNLDSSISPDRVVVQAEHWHRELMCRSGIVLDDAVPDVLAALPIDRRLAALRTGGVDDDLLLLAADYGRYLLIASTLGGTLPPTLQGIWNQHIEPAWSARWTLNINLQMNFWAAEPYGLPEAAEVLARFIDSLADSGTHTAKAIYDTDGWVVHHNTDIWRATEPTTMVEVGLFPGATAWLCEHLWQRYQYDPRPQVLTRIYPTLAAAARFVEGWLVEDTDGHLVTSPSSNPENAYLMSGVQRPRSRAEDPDYSAHAWLCQSPTIDVWLVGDLLDHCVEAAHTLGRDETERHRWATIRARLRPIPIINGRIPDWTTHNRELELGHRHLSPLYGVFPSGLDVRAHPALAAAASATLLHRQAHVESSVNGWGGWSRIWAGAVWARLRDGERGYDSLLHWLRTGASPALLCVFPEYDGQPAEDAIFQIDANLGLPAAIAELIVQSHTDRIDVLPALPARWRAGHANGLRCRGGVSLDLRWTHGAPQHLALTPDEDRAVRVTLPAGCWQRLASVGAAVVTQPVQHADTDRLITLTARRRAVLTFQPR